VTIVTGYREITIGNAQCNNNNNKTRILFGGTPAVHRGRGDDISYFIIAVGITPARHRSESISRRTIHYNIVLYNNMDPSRLDGRIRATSHHDGQDICIVNIVRVVPVSPSPAGLRGGYGVIVKSVDS